MGPIRIAAVASMLVACAGAGSSDSGPPQFTSSAGTGSSGAVGMSTEVEDEDETGAVPETCGDAMVDADEDCDGAALDGATCMSLGFDDGDLSCGAGCQFVTSGCWTCGDGAIGLGEVCDGMNLAGETCESLGFGEGMLTCAADCASIDTSGCAPICGTSPEVNPMGACPGQCDACVDDTCVITCNDPVECESDVVQCPEDWNCRVTCAGSASCRISEFNCPQSGDCFIECLWNDACELSQIHCGEGRCDVYCSDRVDACHDLTVNCGENACISTCEEDYDDAPTMLCGDACECGLC